MWGQNQDPYTVLFISSLHLALHLHLTFPKQLTPCKCLPGICAGPHLHVVGTGLETGRPVRDLDLSLVLRATATWLIIPVFGLKVFLDFHSSS